MDLDPKELPDLDHQSYKPLYTQLSDAILHSVHQKQLKPGDKLPSETDLVKRYGISRMTVRIAIQRLATEGIISKVQGKGTFIAETKIGHDMRGLQSIEENLAQKGIIVTNELIEAANAYPTQLWLNELGLLHGSQAFRIRRLKKIGAKALGYEVRFLPLDVANRFKLEEFNSEGSSMIQILGKDPETKVHRLIARSRGSVLFERDADMIGSSVGAPALLRLGTYYNKGNKPIMTGRITFLAERVEFVQEYWENGIMPGTIVVR